MQSVAWIPHLLALPRSAKQGLQASCDFLLLVLALYLAYVLRMESFGLREPLHFAAAAPTGAAVGVLVFERMGLYRALVRYGGNAHWPAIAAGLLAAALALSVLGWMRELFVPRSVPPLMIVVGLPLVGGARVLAQRVLRHRRDEHRAPVAIYGAGAAGSELANALQAGHEFRPVFFVDDNSALHRSSVRGLRVFGPQQLETLIADYEVSRVFMAIPGAGLQRKREILERLVSLPVPLLTVPSVAELVSGKLSISALREVSVADLLGREPVPPLPQWFDADIRGKVVMVTGAGGSIGSELCRLALSRAPRILLLFELSELALYGIEAELRALNEADPQTAIYAVMGSVQDEALLRRVMRSLRVDTVYHAAAYKHVPLVEANLAQGLLNNVFGTLAAAQSAMASGVSTFVLISTDKAVRPTSVMGASKRIAELVCQALAATQGAIRFSMVRFGNVLDSSGSVVPLFRKQIRAGGPVTVTHPEVIRYFMTIREAAELVIQAGAMAKGGEVFVLDMGEPVRIAELAQRMIQLSGLQPRTTQTPEGDIEIRFIGLRPGEKLYEELLIGGEVTATGHPRIMGCHESYLSLESLLPQLQALRTACTRDDPDEIRSLLKSLPLQYGAVDRPLHPPQQQQQAEQQGLS